VKKARKVKHYIGLQIDPGVYQQAKTGLDLHKNKDPKITMARFTSDLYSDFSDIDLESRQAIRKVAQRSGLSVANWLKSKLAEELKTQYPDLKKVYLQQVVFDTLEKAGQKKGGISVEKVIEILIEKLPLHDDRIKSIVLKVPLQMTKNVESFKVWLHDQFKIIFDHFAKESRE